MLGWRPSKEDNRDYKFTDFLNKKKYSNIYNENFKNGNNNRRLLFRICNKNLRNVNKFCPCENNNVEY